MTKSKFGFELLVEQVLNEVAGNLSMEAHQTEKYAPIMESPIERLFVCALSMSLRYVHQYDDRQLIITHDAESALPKCAGGKCLLIQPQVQIDGVGRVDFVIFVWREAGWRRLIVECDGHDFHERTKDQAARDRSRDRAALLAGHEVFRFTGSELWRDPLNCGLEVIEWINRAG